MRIAFLVFALDDAGGTSSAVITQANTLVGSHDVQLVSVVRTADRPHFPIDPRVRVDHVTDARPSTGSGGLDQPSRLVPEVWDAQFSAATDSGLVDFLPTVRADVLVTTTPALLAVATQLLHRDVAVVHQEHRSSSNRQGGMEPLLAFAPRADVVALLTEDMAVWLRGRLGAVAPEIVAVPNALPVGYRPQSLLDQPLIVSAGRLAAEKQWPRLINAFAEVADQLPGWRLRIFGDGPSRPGLVRTIRRTGLFDRVELPGITRDLPGELAAASVVALTSVAEGLPLVVQEALAAGVPVASFDCASGPRVLIEHDVTGLLVTPDSTPAMAAALLRLASDQPLRERLGAAARASMRHFDAATVADRWVTIFERAVAEHGRPRPPVIQPAPSDTDIVTITPEQARHDALTAVVAAASSSGDDWLVIPPRRGSPPVVVVSNAAREDFLAAVTGPAYLRIRQPERFGWPERYGDIASQVQDLRRGMLPSFMVEPWPGDEEAPNLLSQGCSVEVEFWDRRADGDLVAPWVNPWTWRFPPGAATASIDIHGVRCRTLPVMASPTVTDVRFPIDVVYTWVDGSDPAWERSRLARLQGLGGVAVSRASSGSARYADRDELRHSLRSVELFAPWVRTIHIVTDGQVPAWLDTSHPRIRLVDHREILPADALPTFNSQAIETSLHHVPGLAEHFVYVNDDCFLGRPLAPEQFFDSAGRFAAFFDPSPVGLGDLPDAPSYLQAAANNRRLLQETFGVVTTSTLAHSPHPHRVSVLGEMESRFGAGWQATAHAPFRSETDLAPLSSFAQHYGLLTGTAYEGEAIVAFVDTGARDLVRRFAQLGLRQQDFFCLSDPHEYALAPARVAELLASFLAGYVPVPAPWEITAR